MTTYNTYQEAKIANPESLICKFGDKFTIDASRYGQALQPCNPADYCMSADDFRGRGHAFVDDDLVVNINGMVQSVKADFLNTVDSPLNLCTFVLRAAALENQMNIDNLATQTPEEKEALDLIDTTPHQYEMSKFSGNEWKNGDELDWLTPDNKWCMCEHLFIGKHSNGSPVIEHKTTGNMFETYWCAIRKPETPQQREERERLEAAEDLYITYMSKWEFAQDWRALDEINKSAFLAIVDKTNYRKESN